MDEPAEVTPSPAQIPIRVFLLDDHDVVRRGIADPISTDPGITVVGEARTALEALNRIPAVRPDVAILDARLPDGSGIDVCRDIRSAMPEVRCVMLTSYDDDDALMAAVLAGASGLPAQGDRRVEPAGRDPHCRRRPLVDGPGPPAASTGAVAGRFSSGYAVGFTHPARTRDPGPDRRRTDQPADWGPHLPVREDGEELRLGEHERAGRSHAIN